ncbi:MAG: hypothetical protein NTX64_12255 [Elusimicrobia bacterium]|nr:hypothetical protein [Elusimicrobiota bacterium]
MSLLLAMLFALGAPAHAERASFELKPPPGAVSIGAPVELEGTARFGEKLVLSFDPAAQSSSPAVVVVGVEPGPARSEGGQTVQPVKLRVAAFELGVVTVPALHWTLAADDGTKQTLDSPPVKFESVGPAGAGKEGSDIRDIRPPLRAPWWLWGGPLALLAAAAAAWHWRRRKTAAAGAAPQAVDKRLPHERALDELNLLYNSQVPAKEFYSRLTDILRIYFEARFSVAATVLTTHDLMRGLREAELDRPVLLRCREVFDHADLVKFARWIPNLNEVGRDWSEAEHIVRETAPPPPKPAQAVVQP